MVEIKWIFSGKLVCVFVFVLFFCLLLVFFFFFFFQIVRETTIFFYTVMIFLLDYVGGPFLCYSGIGFLTTCPALLLYDYKWSMGLNIYVGLIYFDMKR